MHNPREQITSSVSTSLRERNIASQITRTPDTNRVLANSTRPTTHFFELVRSFSCQASHFSHLVGTFFRLVGAFRELVRGFCELVLTFCHLVRAFRLLVRTRIE